MGNSNRPPKRTPMSLDTGVANKKATLGNVRESGEQNQLMDGDAVAQYSCHYITGNYKSTLLKTLSSTSKFGRRYVYFELPNYDGSPHLKLSFYSIHENDEVTIRVQGDGVKNIMDGVEYRDYATTTDNNETAILRLSTQKTPKPRIVYVKTLP